MKVMQILRTLLLLCLFCLATPAQADEPQNIEHTCVCDPTVYDEFLLVLKAEINPNVAQWRPGDRVTMTGGNKQATYEYAANGNWIPISDEDDGGHDGEEGYDEETDNENDDDWDDYDDDDDDGGNCGTTQVDDDDESELQCE